jgi:N-methylhydantoinase A
MGEWRLSIDIGGTFTDVVLLNAASGAVVVDKTLTTPARPLEGVRQGVVHALEKAGIPPADVGGAVLHATTLVTNALIEGKIARAALVTTAGFADTMLIRNEHRYDMYDVQIEFPAPPIPRELTFEVRERTRASGEVLEAPSREETDRLAEQLEKVGAEALAVCFLHSYANPGNERTVAEALRSRLGIPLCVSSEVAPQIREYPRTVTTACNAATMPITGRYLSALTGWLRETGFEGSLLIMLSNGGVVSADVAAATPVRMVESGPAAGALAGAWLARRLGEERLLSFDMGGTTAKACLIEQFEPTLTSNFEIARMYRFKRGSGFPLTVPSVDLVEVGAGGGSIARTDELGLLKVGPESAGAEPGPACYGRGGTEVTVTDADLLLGFLDPDYFLGGEMPLHVGEAERAVGKVAAALGTSLIDAAAGIHELVNQNMAAAARMHGVERGADLRGVPIVAFGGAGPVHACGVADLLESDHVVFPANASVLSAFGILVTPVRIDLARSLLSRLAEVGDDAREALLEEMRTEGRAVLEAAGVAPEAIRFRYAIDARYAGQGNEITVWVGEGDRWPVTLQRGEELFTKEYESVYGMSIPDVPVEVVTWRVSAGAPAPALEPRAPGRARRRPTPKARRPVHFRRGAGPVEVPVYERSMLSEAMKIPGPAVVQERETTIVLRPGWSAEVIWDGSVVARRGGM